jgi:hypothetical protein
MTKAEMLKRFQEGRPIDPNFAKHFKIGKWGKDQNHIFYELGKIHGLENICYLSE